MNKEFDVKNNSYAHRKRLLFFKNQLSLYPKANPKILDIGCGSGLLLSLPLAEEGYNITGIDLDQTSIDFINRINKFPNAKFFKKRLEECELDAFDIIIASEMLEHLESPKELLGEIKKRINPDSMLIVTVPNGYGCFEFEKAIVSIFWKIPFTKKILHKIKTWEQRKKLSIPITLNAEDKHLQHFTLFSIKKILNEAGFEIVKQKNTSLLGGPISERIWGRCNFFLSISEKLGDIFPAFLANGWYFILKNKKN